MRNFDALLRPITLLVICGAFVLSAASLYSQSIRLDESQSIWISTKTPASILRFTAEDVHVPLFGLLLHFWMQVFGTDISMVRIMSLVLFLATLPPLYLLTKESSNQRTALLTTALFSLSPFVVWYSNEARMYTLFTFSACLSHLYYLRVIRSVGKNGKLGYFMATALGFYTHYFFLFLLSVQLLYVWWRFLKVVASDPNTVQMGWWRTARTHLSLPLTILGLVGAAALLFMPWVGYVISRGSASGTKPLIPAPTGYSILQTFALFLFGFQGVTVQSVIISLWPLVAIVLFAIFTQQKRVVTRNFDYFLVASFLPVAMVYAASFIRPIFLSRYLIFVVPSLFYLMAVVILNHSRKIALVLSLAVMTVMGSFLIYQNVFAVTPLKENYYAAATYLRSQAGPWDVIAVSAPFTVYPIEYYYTGAVRIDTIPFWDRFSQGGIPEFTEEKLAQQIEGYRERYSRVFILLSYNQGYEKRIVDYMDTHYEMLDSQKFSEGIQVRVYKLKY